MTPEQIERAIPRCATWPPRFWDTTEDKHRRAAAEWLAGILAKAEECGTIWPPPAKGTHESDLDFEWEHGGARYVGNLGIRGGLLEYNDARDWSRSA